MITKRRQSRMRKSDKTCMNEDFTCSSDAVQHEYPNKELRVAWAEFKNVLKSVLKTEKPFCFIYRFIVWKVEMLARLLSKLSK